MKDLKVAVLDVVIAACGTTIDTARCRDAAVALVERNEFRNVERIAAGQDSQGAGTSRFRG